MNQKTQTQSELLRELAEATKDAVFSPEEIFIGDVQIPNLRIRQAATKEESLSGDTPFGAFYSTDAPFDAAMELYVTLIKVINVRKLWSATTGSGAHLACACADAMRGIGNPYAQDATGGGWHPTETERLCAYCAHNPQRDRSQPAIESLTGDISPKGCGGAKVFLGVILRDLERIAPETVMPFRLQTSSGVYSGEYTKHHQSWNAVNFWLRQLPQSLPLHAVVFRMSTATFKFSKGSAYQPVFEIARLNDGAMYAGQKVLQPMRPIVSMLQPQLALTAGNLADAEPETGEMITPAFTGKPQD